MLTPKHEEQLKRESGLNKDILKLAKLESFSVQDSKNYLKGGGSGIAFYYSDLHGLGNGYRVKQDIPSRNKYGRINKYIASKDSDAFIYFLEEQIETLITSENLIIVEGEKKLLKFLQENETHLISALAIAGCWMFRKKDQAANELHPLLEDIIKYKKTVTIIPDSDYFENHKVKSAYNLLAQILFSKGITVSIIDLRIKDINEKIGVDDFLMKKDFLILKELINRPSVTFKKMEGADVMDFINQKGTSEKTFEDLFSSLAFYDHFEITPIIQIIKGKKGLKEKNLWNAYKKVVRKFRPRYSEDSPDFYIKYDKTKHGQDFLFEKIGNYISTLPFLFLNEEYPSKLINVEGDFDKVRVANTKEELYDVLGELVVIEEIKDTEMGEITLDNKPLSRDLVSIFFNSINNYAHLRKVKLIIETPYFEVSSNKLLAQKGYNGNFKILLTKDYRLDIKSKSKLEHLLNNTPFKSLADRDNFLAILLTGVVFKNSLPGEFPSLFVRAQGHGSGKSSLAKATQYLIDENVPGPITYKGDEEFEKHLAAQMQRSSTIVIDNIRVKSLNSPVLESLITTPEASYRRLGTQTEIKRVNNILCILTMNGGGMTPDLISRLIVVNLDKSKLVGSSGFEPLEYVKIHRKEIIEEILGLIMKTDFKNNEDFSYSTRFYKWEKILLKVMRANGFDHFLENVNEMDEALDQDLIIILENVIGDPNSYSSPITAQFICNKLKESNRHNQHHSFPCQNR